MSCVTPYSIPDVIVELVHRSAGTQQLWIHPTVCCFSVCVSVCSSRWCRENADLMSSVPEGHPDVNSLGDGSELCPYLRRTSGTGVNHTPANGGVVPGLVTVAVLLDMLGVAIVIPLLPTYAKVTT